MALVFLTTFPTKASATRFAREAVKGNYATCINIVPQIHSIYRWKGKIAQGREVLIVGKATSVQFQKLKKKFRQLHPYELPELIALKISDGLKAYLNWIAEAP